jgi:putative oxygen-independent coproporphyrinogen III oxidase
MSARRQFGARAAASPPAAGKGETPAHCGGELFGAAAEPLAVYVHWPFCRSKCPYCDFNSHVRDAIDARRWTRALLADIDYHAATAPDYVVGSIFFGGGTPSLMPPETAAAVVERVRSHWPAADAVEITLEANPNSAEAGRFRAYAGAGVNRLSLGVQSLDPAALRFLGRAHDRAEAIAALELAHATFARFSFDLIYSLPGQTIAAWRRELDEASVLAGDHLSLYQLTIEPGTVFAARSRRGDLIALDDDTAARLYEITQDRVAAAGLPAYEISNHSRPGGECRHNLAYWRYQDYVGIGPGAHGRLTRAGIKYQTRQRRRPEAWLAAVERDGTGLEESTSIDREVATEEMLLMGLRLREGIARDRLEKIAGQSIETRFAHTLPRLIDGGFVSLDNERLAATAAGRQRLNAVLTALLG